ncbi:hypothetical protein [Phaffia rhodozyma]|uniref:Uncharacterized protein n=1 Tax=Phaffia rhodozyma TaxID=264483 RepID=A0A0F7SFH3_PHARH|nr:hypothetical protein [Phaffia rhodozyma]
MISYVLSSVILLNVREFNQLLFFLLLPILPVFVYFDGTKPERIVRQSRSGPNQPNHPPPMYKVVASPNLDQRMKSHPPLKIKTRTQLVSLITSFGAFQDKTLIQRALDDYCRGKLGNKSSKERLEQKLHMVEATMYDYQDLGLPDYSSEFIHLRKTLGLQSSKIFTQARSPMSFPEKKENEHDPFETLSTLGKY